MQSTLAVTLNLHSLHAKKVMINKLSKHPLGVDIYDLNLNLIRKFANNVELKTLNISKVTRGKYLNNGFLYKNMYIFKPIQP